MKCYKATYNSTNVTTTPQWWQCENECDLGFKMLHQLSADSGWRWGSFSKDPEANCTCEGEWACYETISLALQFEQNGNVWF